MQQGIEQLIGRQSAVAENWFGACDHCAFIGGKGTAGLVKIAWGNADIFFECTAEMANAFIETMKLHEDGSLEIKLSYMDEFMALTTTCERLRKEVA